MVIVSVAVNRWIIIITLQQPNNKKQHNLAPGLPEISRVTWQVYMYACIWYIKIVDVVKPFFNQINGLVGGIIVYKS